MTTSPDADGANPKPVKRRTGRRAVLDERKKIEICAIVAVGCSRMRAATYVGCDAQTIVITARREPEFAAALRQAEVQREVTLLAKIQEAAKAKGGWKAAGWLLERFYPDRYGTRRAGTLTREQVGTLLSQFSEIVTRGIRNTEDRARVETDLRHFAGSLAVEGTGEKVR